MSTLENGRKPGFTLIEMMIVVVIIGILSVIAIPTFRGYMYASKTTEATTFLGEIRQRQESYRSEHSQYCNVDAWAPLTVPGSSSNMWPGDATTASQAAWTQLGAAPDGYVYFRYLTVAGPPGTDPSDSTTLGSGSTLGYGTTDFWFVAQAQADLDADGLVLTFESYSENSAVWVSQPKGWE